jgi:hypothetical protein
VVSSSAKNDVAETWREEGRRVGARSRSKAEIDDDRLTLNAPASV